jgi:hypothetical protein
MANLSFKQRQRQQRHGRPTILLLSMLLLLVLLTEQVQGQRVATSLGSKIKSFGRKKSSSSNGNGYVVKGELDDSSFFPETEILAAGLVVCVTVLLSFWNTLFNKKDGESISLFIVFINIIGVVRYYW